MRTFLLRNRPLTRCGNRSGNGTGGISYFCPGCGQVWASVELGTSEWCPATVPCSSGCGHRPALVPGSFLKILSWWDDRNGNSLAAQLNHADSTLLEYEAERYIDWRLNDISSS